MCNRAGCDVDFELAAGNVRKFIESPVLARLQSVLDSGLQHIDLAVMAYRAISHAYGSNTTVLEELQQHYDESLANLAKAQDSGSFPEGAINRHTILHLKKN